MYYFVIWLLPPPFVYVSPAGISEGSKTVALKKCLISLISDSGPQQLQYFRELSLVEIPALDVQTSKVKPKQHANLIIHGRRCYSKTHYASCQGKVSPITQSSKLPGGI